MTPIAIRRGGDRSTRGTIAGRSPLLAAQHSFIRRSVALLHDLRFVVSSGVGCRRGVLFDSRNLELVKARQPLKFVPVLKASGSLIPGLPRSAALQACKQSRRCVSKAFHFILSAPPRGLVGCFDRHEATKEKFPHDGKTGTRPGNLTARKRNAY